MTGSFLPRTSIQRQLAVLRGGKRDNIIFPFVAEKKLEVIFLYVVPSFIEHSCSMMLLELWASIHFGCETVYPLWHFGTRTVG